MDEELENILSIETGVYRTVDQTTRRTGHLESVTLRVGQLYSLIRILYFYQFSYSTVVILVSELSSISW